MPRTCCESPWAPTPQDTSRTAARCCSPPPARCTAQSGMTRCTQCTPSSTRPGPKSSRRPCMKSSTDPASPPPRSPYCWERRASGHPSSPCPRGTCKTSETPPPTAGRWGTPRNRPPRSTPLRTCPPQSTCSPGSSRYLHTGGSFAARTLRAQEGRPCNRARCRPCSAPHCYCGLLASAATHTQRAWADASEAHCSGPCTCTCTAGQAS